MAPSTPPPPSSEELAALTMASTASVVISARTARKTAVMSVLLPELEPQRRAAFERHLHELQFHDCVERGPVEPAFAVQRPVVDDHGSEDATVRPDRELDGDGGARWTVIDGRILRTRGDQRSRHRVAFGRFVGHAWHGQEGQRHQTETGHPYRAHGFSLDTGSTVNRN